MNSLLTDNNLTRSRRSSLDFDSKKEKVGGELRLICGHEAGCMGYALYHDLTRLGIDCVILAPTSMPKFPAKSIKTDKRD